MACLQPLLHEMMLLSSKWYYCLKCQDGRTPLYLACGHQHWEMAKWLVAEGGADPNIQDEVTSVCRLLHEMMLTASGIIV